MYTQEAVKYFKSKTRLAAALQISPAAVSQWGAQVPMLRQFQLQMITCGELKASNTRHSNANAA
jgi:hypothetical protein